MWARAKEAQGIEVALEVSPFTEGFEDALPFRVGAVVRGFYEGRARTGV